jgi:hypothetical protein
MRVWESFDDNELVISRFMKVSDVDRRDHKSGKVKLPRECNDELEWDSGKKRPMRGARSDSVAKDWRARKVCSMGFLNGRRSRNCPEKLT